MDLDKSRTSFINMVTTGTMLLYNRVIHHAIVFQSIANVSVGASVSLLQTKTLFMRVKRVFVLMFSKVRHFLFARPVSREMKRSKGAPKIRQPTLCQQTQRKWQSVFSD